MENKNVFDVVMDYIDEHIKLSSKEISNGVYEKTGYTEADISMFIVIISSGAFSLKGYIAQRRAFLQQENWCINQKNQLWKLLLIIILTSLLLTVL